MLVYCLNVNASKSFSVENAENNKVEEPEVTVFQGVFCFNGFLIPVILNCAILVGSASCFPTCCLATGS